MTKSELARDKRLRKKYGISLTQYGWILAAQNGVCAICGRPPRKGGLPLVVDHKHFKITAYKYGNSPNNQFKWIANTEGLDQEITGYGKTKKDAIEAAREKAKIHSVRGLLCAGRHSPAGKGACNRNIGRVDSVPFLLKAIIYLENPPARKILESGNSGEYDGIDVDQQIRNGKV